MLRNSVTRRNLIGAAAASVAAAAWASTASAEPARPRDAVVAWIDRHAKPIGTTDPTASLRDLAPLRTIVGSADVVGLGEWSHGSREQFLIKHRMVRFLVERMGFRTVAFEVDFAHGIDIDRYVLAGEGDPAALVRGMSSPLWATQEILDLIEWIAAYNRDHPADPVRFFGADLLWLRESSFEAITAEVQDAAPELLAELEAHLDPIRPQGPEDIRNYQKKSDEEQQVLIEHARAALDLVQDLPPAASETERAVAEQHARTVLGWYEYYAIDTGQPRSVREEYIADAIEWWQHLVGGRTAYWAANIHTCAAASVTYEIPGEATEFTYAGGYMRDRMGAGYISIGTVFGEGSVNSQWFPVVEVAVEPPTEGLLDAVLGKAERPDYLIDLRTPAPRPVRDWRQGQTAVRMIHPVYGEGQNASDHVMSTDSLIDTFDAVIHLRSTSPSTLLD